MHLDDALEDAERLLRRIAGLFLAGRADDRVPPRVGRRLAARGLLRRPPGRAPCTECGRPRRGGRCSPSGAASTRGCCRAWRATASCARAVVVRPDDLVLEALAAEDLVEQHLHVVHLAVVEVHEQAALRRQQPLRFAQARLEEAEVVVERVGVAARGEPLGAIALALESGAVAVGIARRCQRGPPLDPPGVERRVDVDQLERPVGKAAQNLDIVAQMHVDHRASGRLGPGRI